MSRGYLPLCLLGTIAVLALAPWIGVIDLSLAQVLSGKGAEAAIFWRLRLPQVLLAFLVGAALGVAGMIFQALFRNPLATPYTLGVASGSSLGVVLCLFFGLHTAVFGMPLAHLGGFLGALIATGILFLFTRTGGSRSLASLLLVGVALGFLYSSLILVIQYLSSPTQGYISMRWLMGGLETVDYQVVLEVFLVLAIAGLVLRSKLAELDLLAIDDDIALARGVDVAKSQRMLIILGSLLVGIAVSVAGPIGFVGLIVPHAVRMAVGPSHRTLFPLVLLSAGSFLVICDTLGRVAFAPITLPVGVLTALCGVPFFLYLVKASSPRS